MYQRITLAREDAETRDNRWTIEHRRGRFQVLDRGLVVASCSDLRTAEALAVELYSRASGGAL